MEKLCIKAVNELTVKEVYATSILKDVMMRTIPLCAVLSLVYIRDEEKND